MLSIPNRSPHQGPKRFFASTDHSGTSDILPAWKASTVVGWAPVPKAHTGFQFKNDIIGGAGKLSHWFDIKTAADAQGLEVLLPVGTPVVFRN